MTKRLLFWSIGAALASAAPAGAQTDSPAGPWKAALDLAGGALQFRVELFEANARLTGRLCNADACDAFSTVARVPGAPDSLILEMADYAAAIRVHHTSDSLTGFYRNVGNRGPRTIPFRAARGTWPIAPAPASLVGRWDATFDPVDSPSPRVLDFRATDHGLEGTIISNTGDYGLFWGGADADDFWMAHFDGSFVYMLTGQLAGDTLSGIFHAGLTSQRPFVAVRSTGGAHLTPPESVVRADTTGPFRFAFPSIAGRVVTNTDARFANKVLIVDIFGTWCPTCHDAAPTLVDLYDRYHDRGLEIVGLAYEVTGDTAVDGALVRRYRDKFNIEFPLLLAGVNDGASAQATQPQLQGGIAYPTTIFIDRTGRVRKVHAGFYGPATGEAHDALRRQFFDLTEELLRESPASSR